MVVRSDYNGEICYKTSGNIILSNGTLVQAHLNNNILTYNCKTSLPTFTGTLSNQAINVTSLDKFIGVVDLDSNSIGYKVYMNGDGILGKTLTYCQNSSNNKSLWSDNCDDTIN